MLINQTIDKLSDMHLPAMNKEYRRQMEHPQTRELSFDDRFAMLVDAEWISRKNNHMQKLLKRADLKIRNACLEDIDYGPEHNVDKNTVSRLADCQWIKEGKSLIVTGATGVGKTFLICAFGNAACRQGLKTRYYRVNRLLNDLAVGHGDGSYNKLMHDLKKVDLLILDDFGMTVFDPAMSRDLLEVIDDRVGLNGTIFAAQFPVLRWHELFEDSTVADAVLDRVIHSSYRFELKGDTKRKGNATQQG
jgi:DNA replication protein DnaC